MVRLKPLLANILFSKQFAFLLLVVGFVYFTRRASQPRLNAARYAQLKYAYGEDGVLSLNRQGGATVDGELDLFEGDTDDKYAFTGFHSSHVEPSDAGNDVVGSDHVVSRDADDGAVKMSREPAGKLPTGSEQVHAHHSKNPKNLHFSSSHHAPVGQSHVVDDAKHGSFVPHTSKTSGHQMRDPYFSMHVREIEIEKMKTPLPNTLPNYRNPCWVEHLPRGFSYFEHTLYYQYYKYYPKAQPHRDWEDTYDKLDHLIQVRKKRTKDGKSWRLRCFPYFFLIGFTRAGTTDLWRSMSMLPEFVRGLIKEPKFWNKIRLHNYAESLPNATLSDYLDLYDGVAEVIRGYAKKMPDGSFYHPGITADMDPQTIWKLPRWQHINGNEDRDAPKFTTADHLYALKPDAKLIVMLRDPVERAFSHYCFFKTRKKHATKSELADAFHHDVKKAVNKLTRCFKQRGPKSCAYTPPKFSPLAMRSVTVSMYSVFINDWLKVFPRKQFLFIKSEEYFENRVKTIKDISHFLGIDDAIPHSLVESIKEFRVMNPSKKTGMHHETRELLREFFTPFNKKLTSLLKSEKFRWQY